MKIKIQIAGRTVEILYMYPTTETYIGKYRSERDPAISISIIPEDIAFERMKSAKEDALEGIPPRQFSDAYLETIAVQRKITEKLFDYDTLLFHGSVIAVDGAAYLFTAKSGTGKSTHTRLWREMLGDRATMVNDDKPFLQITESAVIVHGSPWNGKHGLGENVAVPLKAICILERGTENAIREIPPKEALTILFQQSSRPRNPGKMPKYLELLDKLAANVKYYKLQCNMDPQAAELSYRVMSGDERNMAHED